MSYFGLVETIFNNGPLSALSNNSLGMSSLKYPIDLGNTDKSHYIVFYAKTQKNTTTTSPNASSSVSEAYQASLIDYGKETVGGVLNSVGEYVNQAKQTVSSTLSNISSNVNDLFGSLTGTSKATQNLIQNSIKQVTGASFNLFRNTQTSDVIALYMPKTLMFAHNQHYEHLRLGDEALGAIMAAGKSAIDAYQSGNSELDKRNAMVSSLTKSAVLSTATHGPGMLSGVPYLGDIVNSNSQTIKLVAAAATGVVANPLLEMMYYSPDFRSFNFEFMFYPRSSKESLMVQNIINKFYYHQAPELVKESQGFLIPPSQFDIKMYCNGQENPNIPTIATCVLENISVDYAPLGFSTYEVPAAPTPSLGGTGMPVAIRLLLQFREITYLTKEDFSG